MLSRVLFVAIVFCILATLTGAVSLTRAALRLSRRLDHLRTAVATGAELAEQAQGLQARALRIRSGSERLRTLTRQPG